MLIARGVELLDELTDGHDIYHPAEVSGSIGLIGVLELGQIDPLPILMKSQRLHSIYMGSRQMFGDINRALSMHEVNPVVDATFALDDAREAYHAMRAAIHFGKLVITF